MAPRSLGGRVGAGPEEAPRGSGVSPDAFREALSYWASGVTVVAVRDEDGKVYATTVSSFGSLSAEPPRVFFSLGPGAQVLPFLEEDARFTVNLLSGAQRRLASRFSDPFPVGASPFPPEGDPVVPGALASLGCTVEKVVPVDPARILVALVTVVSTGDDDDPLLHFRRRYRELR